MSSRFSNYAIIAVLMASLAASLYNVKHGAAPTEEEVAAGGPQQQQSASGLRRFALPTVAMVTFFVACYFISVIVAEGEATGKDKYAGILFLVGVGVILTVFNFTVLAKDRLSEYVKGKKFSVVGLFMALGVSAIVFGFLDNFGMKLGTEALDNTFLQAFLTPFSKDERFLDHQDNIQQNLRTINDWTTRDWRKVMNQTLRFEDEIGQNPKLKDLTNALRSMDTTKLAIPPEILRDRELTNQFVDNLRDKYDIIDGSKAMLGNTFSDFIGAILGAALVSLFVYMTNYDGFTTGDDSIDDNFFVRNLSYYAPFMEACFIALGCLVPVFLNIAMNRRSNKDNNFYAWLVVGVVGVALVGMMYMSSTGVKQMTTDDKRNAIRKTLEGVADRVDLQQGDADESRLQQQVDRFVGRLNGEQPGPEQEEDAGLAVPASAPTTIGKSRIF